MTLTAFVALAPRKTGRGRALLRLVSIVAAASLAAGCAHHETAASTTVVDDAGRTVAVAVPATRVVSLSPATTELLFALGAGDRVVGRTKWDVEPAAASTVPSVGDGMNPNAEAIVARRPDLVIAYASAANAGAVHQLERLRIPTLELGMNRLEDVARAARLLGPLVGAAARADSLATRFDAELDSARARRVTHPPGPSVLLLSWADPPIVIGSGSFQSELVSLAGARNAFSDMAAPSAEVSIEAIAARNPDIVLLTGSGDTAWAHRPEWRAVRAVRDGRFVEVVGNEFAWPSFRAFDAVRELEASLDGVTR